LHVAITSAIKEVDKYRHASQIKDCLETEYCYSNLAKLAKPITCGNADTECVFSHTGHNKTKYKQISSSTLNSLLTVQYHGPKNCYEYKPNTKL